MRQNGNIQLQDPSLSPTYALSQASNNPSVPASLRRNLFASHLSRRPVPQYAVTGAEAMPDPFHNQLIPASSQHTAHERYAQSQLHSQPHPMQDNQYAMHANFHSGYSSDLRVSPTRSLSPNKNHGSLTGSGIVALDPTTGRPALPILPTLPARFRTGESNDEDDEEDGDPEEEDDPDMDYDHSHEAPYRRTRTFDRSVIGQHELDLHSSSMIGGTQPRLHELIDADGGGSTDATDYDKIESILSEMQTQQKARARTTVLPGSSSLSSMETPVNDSRVSARTRGKARATTRSTIAEQAGRSLDSSPNKPRVGGVGATLKPADKDELLGLIMTSLTRRVQEADENAWMFGDEHGSSSHGYSGVGSGSFAHGREVTGVDD